MKGKENIDACLRRYYSCGMDWNDGTGSILMGTWQIYEATGDEKYFSLAEAYLQDAVMEDGTIKDYPEGEECIGGIGCGRILFPMYHKTKDEKYRNAITFVMDKLRECSRLTCDELAYDKDKADENRIASLYKIQPFYMAFETAYDKKEKYNDILNQFVNVQDFLYNKNGEFSSIGMKMRSLAMYLAALVDTMDNMSFEIYEQYRTLQDAFKVTLKNILPYQDKNSRLFPTRMGTEAEEKAACSVDEAASAIIGYCILKACRMGILLKEKYIDSGMEVIERLVEKDIFSNKDFMEDTEGAGMLMMAYGQYLQTKKEMDENG